MTRRTPFALAAAVGVTVLLAACGQSSAGSGTVTPSSPDVASPSTASTSAPAASASSASPSSAAPSTSTAAPKPAAGAYVSYDDYLARKATYDANGKVVLFFHAGWCPTCKRADGNIKGDPVPAGLTIVKTDYDSSDDLKQKYGVTVQHTFVQIDPSGAALKKFTGSDTAQEILDRTV